MVVKFCREDKIRLFSSRGRTNFYQRFLLEYCRHFGLWFRLRHSTSMWSTAISYIGWIFLYLYAIFVEYIIYNIMINLSFISGKSTEIQTKISKELISLLCYFRFISSLSYCWCYNRYLRGKNLLEVITRTDMEEKEKYLLCMKSLVHFNKSGVVLQL